MKIIFRLFVTFGLFYSAIADPTCTFKTIPDDVNNRYGCPLTGGNIDAGYDGLIIGDHFTGKSDVDVLMVIADEAVKEFILKKLFDRFKNLESLEFRKGSVGTITSDMFYNCDKLQKVLIKESVFSTVPDNIFGNCTALKEIDFGNNNINNIDSKAFSGLESLEILRLNENELKAIRQNVFNPLPNLQTLDLSKNVITIFDGNVFSNNKELRVLLLAENKLERIVNAYFGALKALTTLDLTKNVVDSTEKSMVDNLVGLSAVKFTGNKCINKDFQNFKESDVEDFKTCIANFNGSPRVILSSFAVAISLILKFL